MSLLDAVEVEDSVAVALLVAVSLAVDVPVPVAGVSVLEGLAPCDSDAVGDDDRVPLCEAVRLWVPEKLLETVLLAVRVCVWLAVLDCDGV